ncbi:MAG: CDP-diacylglycerol--glycerol-3-phosphate 3-phosphatidyltransferase [Maricaulaceae bacterium]
MTKQQPHLAWVPNALTLGRIAFIPVLIAAILTYGTDKAFLGTSVLFGLFIILVLTDFLDGFLARRWNVTSDFGRMLDPIADKLFVAGLLICFTILTNGTWWILAPTLIIIGRDIFISGLREHAAHEGIVMAPTRLAKWKTATEMLAIAILLIWVLAGQWLPISETIGMVVDNARKTGVVLLWIAAFLSAYTGFFYAKNALKKA